MLVDFILDHRDDLIARTRVKVAARLAPRPTEHELATGVPLFLDELVATLRGPPGTGSRSSFPPGLNAVAHGAALLHRGYSVAQVVHDYGDICQAITELAEELDALITTEEFHTLNKSLDDAIADAMTEYTRLRERTIADSETERLGVFGHELRNRLQTVKLAFQSIRTGRAPLGGSVADVVSRNLRRMGALIDRSLVEVRVDAGSTRPLHIQLHQLVEEAEVDGATEAGVRGVSLSVEPVGLGIHVDVDPQILAGAIANLLQNAFKFTPVGGHVWLRTSVVERRVRIAIEDQCGGLPPGKEKELFGAFRQGGKDRTGLGLGLFISRKGVEACGGVLSVRDVPGTGCVFTIELPLAA